MTTLDQLRAARDAAIARWTDAAGDQSLCRPTGPAPQRQATKVAEGAATALRQVVRHLEREGGDPASALASARADWQLMLDHARNDDWRAYARGGLDALAPLAGAEERSA